MPHFEFVAIYSVQSAKIHISIWEMKGGTYTLTLAKIQVRGIFRIRDIRRNVLPKLIEICMETPCWCSPRLAPTSCGRKPTETHKGETHKRETHKR